MIAINRRHMLRCTRQLLLALAMLSIPALAFADTVVSVAIAPPLLPVYAQPIVPGPGYIWTPGYWAYGSLGYYWVPGTWVVAPFPGALWTPGFWGWNNGYYAWRAGYWGPRVGFYGGVNYGFGYGGFGYQGGYWNNGAFYYNRAVNNVNVTNIQNTYNTAVVNNAASRRVSYNGGTGGTAAQPTPADRADMGALHTPATATQLQHEQAAATNRAHLASVNHGRPSIAATPEPGAFNHSDVVAAEAAGRNAPPNSSMNSQNFAHAHAHANIGAEHAPVKRHPAGEPPHPQSHPEARQ